MSVAGSATYPVGPKHVEPHRGRRARSASSAAGELIPPLVICEGFLSAAQSVVWGNEFRTYLGVGHQQLIDQLGAAQTTPRSGSEPCYGVEQRQKRRSGLGSNRRVVFAPIGPVSSLHDRACELFYALRGGTVDYGEEHARKHGHARWGRSYHEPLCPGWGPTAPGVEGLPAHFLGHSLGGPTILKLQQLLRQGFFDPALGLSATCVQSNGEEEWRAEDLILSVTSVSSPFRGTPLVYSLGSEPVPYPKVRMFSFGDMLSKFIHVAAFFDLRFFDTHADAWHFSAQRRKAIKRSHLPGGVAAATRQDSKPDPGTTQEESTGSCEVAGFRELVKQLWKSDWAGGYDCAPWDCTFAERDKDRPEDGWGLEPPAGARRRKGKTWYRSYAGGMTIPDLPPLQAGGSRLEDQAATRARYQRPETYWSLSPLTYTAHLIGHFDYSRLQPAPTFLASKAEQKGKQGEGAMSHLSSAWWENDGVVPLASQFHPLDCHPDRCRHFRGMPASLPSYKRRKQRESTHSITSSSLPLSPASETATLVDFDVRRVHDQKYSTAEESEQSEEATLLLPLPATQARRKANRSMLGSLSSAAKIAYFTSLRTINLHDAPLVTPSDEDLQSFLPNGEYLGTNIPQPITPSLEDGLQALQKEEKADTQPLHDSMGHQWHEGANADLHAEKEAQQAWIDAKRCERFTGSYKDFAASPTGRNEEDQTLHASREPEWQRCSNEETHESELLDPKENQWYVFHLADVDHTSLCPFWTGSEVQKQFWTGMGSFFASVDRKAGYTVFEPCPPPSPSASLS